MISRPLREVCRTFKSITSAAIAISPAMKVPGKLLLCLALICTLTGTGCTSVKSYPGEKRSEEELARISGDASLLSYNAPVAVILRKVDQTSLGIAQASVDVLPGKHTLLVDCRIRETDTSTRVSLDVEVFAGVRYRLVAEVAAGMRACSEVRLEGTKVL